MCSAGIDNAVHRDVSINMLLSSLAGFKVSFTLCDSANKLKDASQASYSRTCTTHSPSGCLTKGNPSIDPLALS